MENSWEGLLDLFELSRDIRDQTRLIIWKEFPCESPEESKLVELLESIKKLFKTDDDVKLVWFEQVPSNPGIFYLNEQRVNRANAIVIKDFWDTLAGLYLLFLPKEFEGRKLGIGCDDKLIGDILSKYRKLLLKTPDGQELLYIYLENH